MGFDIILLLLSLLAFCLLIISLDIMNYPTKSIQLIAVLGTVEIMLLYSLSNDIVCQLKELISRENTLNQQVFDINKKMDTFKKHSDEISGLLSQKDA